MNNTTFKVKIEGGLTETLTVTQDLKKGDGLDPSLFNLILEHVRQTSHVIGDKILIATLLRMGVEQLLT